VEEMTAKEVELLQTLDLSLRSDGVQEAVRPIVRRVRAELAAEPDALMAWEPIHLGVFGDALPRQIRSAWVFVLRAGANTGAERHPISHQRMMSWTGRGDMKIKKEELGIKKSADEMTWESNVLISDREAPLERRWISIPPNVWHRPAVSPDADWVVVSFHTVSAEELIEERPGRADETRRMRYLEGREG
jgi:hypothetical protein